MQVGDIVRIKGKTVNVSRGSIFPLDQTPFRPGDLAQVKSTYPESYSKIVDIEPLSCSNGRGYSFLIEDLEVLFRLGDMVRIKGKESILKVREILSNGVVRLENSSGFLFYVNLSQEELELVRPINVRGMTAREAAELLRDDLKPMNYVRFVTSYDKKNQPHQVTCYLSNGDGKTHVGVAKCNREAGDTFLRKEARRRARERAECARSTQGTAFFKNGGVCFAYDYRGEV